MIAPNGPRPSPAGGVGALVALAVAGQGATTATTILLARWLGTAEFRAYVVAASVFLVLAKVAPLGVDQLALRKIPPLLAAGDDRGVAGFLRFALRRGLWGALLACCAGLLWGLLSAGEAPEARRAILAAMICVPFGALARLGLEVLSAAGHARAGTAIMRVVVPVAALSLLVGLRWLDALSGAAAIMAWGLAWIAAIALMSAKLGGLRLLSPERSAARTRRWRAEARPLWFYRVAVALQGHAGLLALAFFETSATGIGAYAAAIAITAPTHMLATATNRDYARKIALLLHRRDDAGLAALLRSRRRWLLPCVLALVAAGWLFPGHLLGIFGPAFVEAGRWPVRLLSAAAAVTIYLSLAPTILKYRGRDALVFRAVLLAAVLQVTLLAVLVPRFGPTGAAVAYCLASVWMYRRFAAASAAERSRGDRG